jgi:hypothetical protein
MTRFELVIKSFADPWLRPLTHIALQKNIRATLKIRCTHSPLKPTHDFTPGARTEKKTLESYRRIELCAKQVILCCDASGSF